MKTEQTNINYKLRLIINRYYKIFYTMNNNIRLKYGMIGKLQKIRMTVVNKN